MKTSHRPSYAVSGVYMSMSVDLYATRRGEAHPRAKLTEDDVHLIRALSKEGLSQRAIAKKFYVSKRAIEAIVTGTGWKHI
jgi:DNA-binding NarL/FixJ family response regulator